MLLTTVIVEGISSEELYVSYFYELYRILKYAVKFMHHAT